MALMERRITDLLRGGNEEITVRFDGDDLVELSCHCQYDPALCGEDGKKVLLIRKIEIKNRDGSWSPYPSVTWLDGVVTEEQLVTRAFVKLTGEKGFNIMSSSDGVPDSELIVAAEEAGIYTETID